MKPLKRIGVGCIIASLALSACGGSSDSLGPDAQAVYNTLKKGEEDLKKYESSASVCSDMVNLGASRGANELPGIFPDLAKINRDDLVAGSQRFIEDCQAGTFN